METIITVSVIAFIALMIFIGYLRGLIKMVFSLASLIIVLALVQFLTPIAKNIIKDTPVYNSISTQIEKYVDDKIVDASDGISQTGETAQKNIINNLPLPKSAKEAMIKDNTSDGYKVLGVESFSEYIAAFLTNMLLNAATFAILFILLTLIVQLVVHLLDIIAKLPGLNFLNKGGGALIGMIESVVILWILCIIVTAFSATQWGEQVCKAISSNTFLSLIYDNNAIQMIFNNINILG